MRERVETIEGSSILPGWDAAPTNEGGGAKVVGVKDDDGCEDGLGKGEAKEDSLWTCTSLAMSTISSDLRPSVAVLVPCRE